MARPKQNSDTLPAKERIECAFWKLLSEIKYENISIKALAGEAGINHNSIYYHYDNIDALAKSAFQNVVFQNPGQIVQVMDFTNITAIQDFLRSQPDAYSRYRKLRLFASSDSLYLQTILKEGLQTVWLGQSGKKLEDLSSFDQMELDFIFSAIIALLGREIDPADLEKFLQDNLGQALICSMKRIISTTDNL